MPSPDTVLPLAQAAIVVDPVDELAVARRDLPAGLALRVADGLVVLRCPVAAKHKFALVPLAAGSPVRMYGAPAGIATRGIAVGEALEPGDLSEPAIARPAEIVTLPSGVVPLDEVPTFLGFARGAGGVGTRNHLLVVYTVPCAARAAARVVDACRAGFGFERDDGAVEYARMRVGRPRPPVAVAPSPFAGVDDVVLLEHGSGCGIADHGDLEALFGWIAGYVRNPNVGGALVIGLGCEKAAAGRLVAEYLEPMAVASGKPIRAIVHQAVGSEDVLVRAGIDRAHELLEAMSGATRTPMPLSRLVLGTKCGGSDGFSGISANPTVGWVSDRVVAAGGGVILAEVPEMRGAEQALAARAVSPEVAARVYEVVERYAALAERSGVRLEENPSPGNFADGILTLAMKSLGAVRKAGTTPIGGVLEYGQGLPGAGVYVLDSPGYDVLSAAALPASGATLITFTTGLGTPWGNPVTPVIKISSSSALARHMPDVIDFDAGPVIEGRETIAECGARLLRLVIEVASGRRTCSEERGHRESGFWQRQQNV